MNAAIDKAKVKVKTFIVFETPDADDLNAWESSKEYKEGDQINYEEEALQCFKDNKDKTFDQKKWGTAIIEHTCTIREPDFKVLNAALSSMTNMSGDLDMGAGGKVIFEICKIDASPELKESNGRLLLTLCLQIGGHYLRFYDVEIKKN